MGLSVVTYALSKKYAKEYTDAVVAALPKAVVYRGVVDFYTDLPAVAELGDAYSVRFKYTYRLENSVEAPAAWPTDYFTRTGEGTEINPYVYEAVPVDTEYVTTQYVADTFYLRRQETDGNEFVYALIAGSEPEEYTWVCLGPDINNTVTVEGDQEVTGKKDFTADTTFSSNAIFKGSITDDINTITIEDIYNALIIERGVE